MHLTKLSLQDFRSFAKAEFDFAAGLNVVVAPNGVGKTAMIDAAAVALSALRGLTAPHLRYRDLRAEFGPVTTRSGIVRVSANFGDHRVEVEGTRSRDLADRHLRPTVHRPTSDALNDELRARLEQGKPIPMMVRLGAGRAALETGDLQPPPWQGGAPPEEGDGWRLPTDLAGRWVDVRDAWSWLDYGAARDGKRAIAAVEGIHAALQRAIGASAPPSYDPDLYDFVVDLPDLGLRPVHLMSDGWRGTVAIVVALAIRAAECWPGHPDAPSEAVGTVLIDELEQHLHPRLQQEILGGLRRAFPKLQFIVTTHSPLVLTDALGANDRIILLENDEDGSPTPRVLTQPKGRDIEGIVTGQWFQLLSTLDDDTLDLMARHRAAIRRRAEGLEERAALEVELKARLPRFHPHGLEGFALELAAEVESALKGRIDTWDDLQRVRAEVLRLIDEAKSS